MSFNLDKDDRTVTRFNLSKGGNPLVAETDKKNRPKRWGFLIVLLAIGCVAWFLLRNVSVAPQGDVSMAEKQNDSPRSVAATVSVPVIDSLQNSVPAHFEKGSYVLRPQKDLVNKLTTILSRNPGKKIVIYGFASSEGDVNANQYLSGQRASSFKEYLIGRGVAPEKISTEAKGSGNPVAPNDTEEGRIKNRRVQIEIID